MTITEPEITNQLRRSVRPTNRQLNGEGPTGTGSSTAATRHAARAGAGPAPNIAVRPPRAHARDPTRSVATGAPVKWAGHGLLVHDGFNQSGTGQDAESRGHLSQHEWTHLANEPKNEWNRERTEDLLRENLIKRRGLYLVGIEKVVTAVYTQTGEFWVACKKISCSLLGPLLELCEDVLFAFACLFYFCFYSSTSFDLTSCPGISLDSSVVNV